MPTIKEMAQAHLGNVQKAISDLESQKKNIETEIQKLTSYFNEGLEEINNTTSSSKVE